MTGRIHLHIALDCSGFSLETDILDIIEANSTIVTDTWKGYQAIDEEQIRP
jgi:hypothetical protein